MNLLTEVAIAAIFPVAQMLALLLIGLAFRIDKGGKP